MHKVSNALAKRFSQDPFETYICKQHPCGAWKDKRPLYDFQYLNSFGNQNVFKPIATGKAGDENLELDRTSSMSLKIQTTILFFIYLKDFFFQIYTQKKQTKIYNTWSKHNITV